MNPLLTEAAGSVELGWLLGAMTAVFLAFFVGWVVWAYSPKRKKELDEAALLPFTDGGDA